MISAEISKDIVAKASNRAVVLAADFDSADLGPSMNGGLNVFTTRLDPFRRLAELHRDPTQQGLLSINIQLRTKAAANFRRDHAQFVFRNSDHQGELGSQQVWNLRR